MHIHIATDHAGLELKQLVKTHLETAGHQVTDHGAYDYNPQDDYPEFIFKAAQAVAADWSQGQESLGVIFGGSGNGEQIAANKVAGIRAALVWNVETAKLARQHNQANIISLGARQHQTAEILQFIDSFIAEPFSNEERHRRRIEQIASYERTN